MVYSNPVLNFVARNADFGVFRAARAESFRDYICALLFRVRTTMITSGVHYLNSRAQFWRANFGTTIRCGLAITARQLLLVSCHPTYIHYLPLSRSEAGIKHHPMSMSDPYQSFLTSSVASSTRVTEERRVRQCEISILVFDNVSVLFFVRSLKS